MVNPLFSLGVPNWAWDVIALVITFVAIYILIRTNSMLRNREKIPTDISRKVLHTFMGPLFLVCWLLFSGDVLSRYFAAVVPLLFAILFVAAGTGVWKNEGFIQSMTKEGKPQELLFGTFLYCLVLVWCTISCWYVPVDITSLTLTGIIPGATPAIIPTGTPRYDEFVPTAMLVIGPLAGGDGFADIVGRAWGKRKYKIFAEKSYEGTLAMFFFSFCFTFVLVGVFFLGMLDGFFQYVASTGLYPGNFNPANLILPILIISLVATIVEACSPRQFDNLLVPAFVFVIIWGLQSLWIWEMLNALPLIINYPWHIWTWIPV